MNLVTDFERLDEHEDFRAQISSLVQRLDAVDKTSSRLLLEVERERNRAQQYLAVIGDKTRETDNLVVALRTADDEASQERERQHVLIARLRASVRLNRICVFRVILIVLTNFPVTVGLNLGNQTTCPDQAAPNGAQISKGGRSKNTTRGRISHYRTRRSLQQSEISPSRHLR
jgi:hypothetical protein